MITKSEKYNTQIVEAICRLQGQDVSKLFRWYVRQPMQIQIEAHKLASDLYFQYRGKYPGEKNEVRYSVFILALKKMKHFDNVLMEKNPDHDLRKIRKITEMKADRFLARKKANQKKQQPAKKKTSLLLTWPKFKYCGKKDSAFA